MGKINFNDVLSLLPERIASVFRFIPQAIQENTYELRLRNGKPLILFGKDGSSFVYENSSVSKMCLNGVLTVADYELRECTERICSYSVYSHQTEMAEGYVTLPSGIRAGFCGRAVVLNGAVSALRDITSINIRLPGYFPDAANALITELYGNGGFNGVIIAGPPCSGKTTLLKSFAYQLSSAYQYEFLKTVIIDERFEFGCLTGINADIISGYEKKAGIIHAVRVLSPQLIVCDELADNGEADSIISCMNTGVKFAVSVHCRSRDDLLNRSVVKKLLNAGCFDWIILLEDGPRPGIIKKIYNTEVFQCENSSDNGYSRKFFFSGIPDYQPAESAL